jgi:hypothetical protein
MTPQQGTTFTFELPLADEDAESEDSGDADALGAAIATASASGRSSLESNGWGDAASHAAAAAARGGGALRGSIDLGRLAAALRRRLSLSQQVRVFPPQDAGAAQTAFESSEGRHSRAVGAAIGSFDGGRGSSAPGASDGVGAAHRAFRGGPWRWHAPGHPGEFLLNCSCRHPPVSAAHAHAQPLIRAPATTQPSSP